MAWLPPKARELARSGTGEVEAVMSVLVGVYAARLREAAQRPDVWSAHETFALDGA